MSADLLPFRGRTKTINGSCGEPPITPGVQRALQEFGIEAAALAGDSPLSPLVRGVATDLQRLQAVSPLTVAAIHRYILDQLALDGGEGA